MKKRVLVLNHFAVHRGSAGGTRHVELFGRLRDWDACVIAADRNLQTGKKEVIRSASFRTVPTTPFSSRYATRVINWVSYGLSAFVVGLSEQERPAIVYGSSPHLLAGLAALGVARLRRARFILEIRDIWPLILAEMAVLDRASRTYRSLERLERFLYRKADTVVVLAEGTAARLTEFGVPSSKICVIPNGAEPADFVPSTPRDEMRLRLSLSGFVVVYAGSHGAANGLELVLDAAAELRDELTDLTFLLVGDGPTKASLERRTASEQLGNVIFLEPVPKAQIADILGAADVGLHVLADVPLFRYGVSPNKIHDYMAAGLPVLTNTMGEVAELVAQADAGLAVEPDQLARGVRSLRAASDEQRQRWGVAGQDFLAAHRSYSVLAQRLETLLDSIFASA
jgi:glycosyltransferase involved in cell wall biosynthesis